MTGVSDPGSASVSPQVLAKSVFFRLNTTPS